MAAWEAGAAFVILFKTHWHLVGSKGDRVCDMLWVVGGMGIMTGTTGTSFWGLVHMYIMEILVTITKTREGCCRRIFYQSVVVAHEAEFEVVWIVRGIKLIGKVSPQYTKIF